MNRKIKKILCISICILSISSVLTGCDIEIPFKTFIINNNDKAIIEDVKIDGIDLSKNITNQANMERFQAVADTIFKQLGDKNFYADNYDSPSRYNYVLQNYLSTSFYKSIISGSIDNDFKKVIDNIYFKENTLFKNANIIETGQDINGYYYDIEIVSVDDEITFNTETIRFIVDKNFKITSTKIIKQIAKIQNTTTPLTVDSLLPDTHEEFLDKFETFLDQINNKKIFESISKGYKVGDADVQLEALISNITLPNKDTESLKRLFLMGKGTFTNRVLVSYKMDDIDKMATSVYTIAFSKEDTIEKFDIYYSRITKEITNIVREKEE